MMQWRIDPILEEYFTDVTYRDTSDMTNEMQDFDDYDFILMPRNTSPEPTDIAGFELSDRLKREYNVKTFIYGAATKGLSDPYTRYVVHPAMQKYNFDAYCELAHDLFELQLKNSLEDVIRNNECSQEK